MQQIAIIGLMLVNVGLGYIALRPATKEPIDWQTLIIWRDAEYRQVAMSWWSGAITKQQAEQMQLPMNGAFVLETFTVPGPPRDAEWVQSLPPS